MTTSADRRMSTHLVYCGEAVPTQECVDSGWCDHHGGRVVMWHKVMQGPIGPERTEIQDRRMTGRELVAIHDRYCACGGDHGHG